MKRYLKELTVKRVALGVAETIRWTYGSVGLLLLIRGYWLPDLYMVCIGGLIFYSAVACFTPLVDAFVEVITGEDDDEEEDEDDGEDEDEDEDEDDGEDEKALCYLAE